MLGGGADLGVLQGSLYCPKVGVPYVRRSAGSFFGKQSNLSEPEHGFSPAGQNLFMVVLSQPQIHLSVW
ncbi:hypothetical protein HYQ45_015364 [Verticillium longisporum]|uniref:Uncharacterized protein n=1 Tax=Verticillium longisporum TaxID=100787 RepID=A0A8I3AHH7_VERLO|nr:hypothetical protein HYQ45_015364 [Verticillium longisporum]KAG7119826.1 hypothetical protein HYQ44_004322 [Verticillium longisporum]